MCMPQAITFCCRCCPASHHWECTAWHTYLCGSWLQSALQRTECWLLWSLLLQWHGIDISTGATLLGAVAPALTLGLGLGLGLGPPPQIVGALNFMTHVFLHVYVWLWGAVHKHASCIRSTSCQRGCPPNFVYTCYLCWIEQLNRAIWMLSLGAITLILSSS